MVSKPTLIQRVNLVTIPGDYYLTFLNMSDVLTARNIYIETRKRLARCYALLTFLHASETWTLNADTCKKINSFEMWIYRKMLKISYTSHTTNEELLKRVNEKGLSQEKNIKMRSTQYLDIW